MTNCPCDKPADTEGEIARALNSIAAGQTALARQVRTFPGVREALLDALPNAEALGADGEVLHPLVPWRARNSRDLGLMLLEMWAYVSDVLSFYDERIANESYIRTAQRPLSLRRLVELLGYIPAPGIAGSVTLAALAEGRKPIALPTGTAFRSDAFGTEPPQVFEITTPTTIHPFKNEWTIGAQKVALVPSPTPTFIERKQSREASGDIFDEEPGRWLVFETLEFGLAVDRLAVVQFGSADARATRVESIRPFAGKDGRTYAEVEFSPSLIEQPVPPERVSVLVPTVPATATRHQALTPAFSPDMTFDVDPEGSGKLVRVYLDSVYRQVQVNDYVIVATTDGGDPQIGKVRLAQERTAEIRVQPANQNPPIPPTRVPITYLELLGDFTTLDDDTDEFSLAFHFSFVNGGRVTVVGETELTPQGLTVGLLPIQGIVDRPPEVDPPTDPLAQQFLLTDPDANGALVDGLMFFGADGRAQFSIQEDPAATPPPLPAALYKTPISVFGNIITATRGETIFNEALGNGDPRIPAQKFTLKKKPLTYTDAPNELGRESSLQLFVDGVRWKEVRTFFSCGPQDHVYTVRHDAEQNTIITFGDGVRGARVPSGVANVRATYRFGAGAKAPPAGAIQQLARPVIGLRGVRSPIAAQPGRDPDSAETLRNDAPVSARLLKRAVSPQDFQAIASLERGVVRAVADFRWIEEQQQAGVTITYIGERDPDALREKLGEFGELGLPIFVERAEKAFPTLTVTVAKDPAFERTAFEAAIRAALLDPVTGPLALANTPIGGRLLISPLYELLHSIPGVVAVQSLDLQFTDQNQNVYIPRPLGEIALVCIPDRMYLDFTDPSTITIAVVDPSGPTTAQRDGGC